MCSSDLVCVCSCAAVRANTKRCTLSSAFAFPPFGVGVNWQNRTCKREGEERREKGRIDHDREGGERREERK